MMKYRPEYLPTYDQPIIARLLVALVSYHSAVDGTNASDRTRTFGFPIKTKVKMVVSKLEVSIKGQPTHLCNHYHWVDWPDRGVPEADLAPVILLSKLRSCSGPIIVHCSAGIGRTGSIVLIEHAIELLKANKPLLEISHYMVELRKQRNNSVQKFVIGKYVLDKDRLVKKGLDSIDIKDKG
ncbi:Protein-tyrosine phosphatase [Dictyocaulus viviparus]|uniref:Protein-tyrosine phosphatase n=1 Tax=Dictyocaulus viviparus TaxID=29172 RepID=A0A0D8XMU6_DICVI|nr:Protein-tyrosine phosphatase [Dictyocaulus viviparus]